MVVISRGTGWKWTYAADEIVAFSDVCWSRSLSRLFLTRKGQRKQEYTEREIPFPWLPIDCLPRWEAGLLPLYFIPWWCILDNCEKPHFQGELVNCDYSINIKPPQQFRVSPFALCASWKKGVTKMQVTVEKIWSNFGYSGFALK